jgi:hypothetical protein
MPLNGWRNDLGMEVPDPRNGNPSELRDFEDATSAIFAPNNSSKTAGISACDVDASQNQRN